MGIPSYEQTMLPMLRLASDKKEHSQLEAVEYVSHLFKLSDAERRQLLPSGLQPVIDNRVGWARTYLKKAGLLGPTREGHFRITERGLRVLSENPSEINTKFLMQFAEFVEFRTKRASVGKKESAQKTLIDTIDPQEMLENAHKRIKDELANELLERIKKSPAQFFEEVVVELARALSKSMMLQWASFRR